MTCTLRNVACVSAAHAIAQACTGTLDLCTLAAGKLHEFSIKTMDPVLWRKAGPDLLLRVMVIAPLGYRLRNGSRMLYRQPAFLICTDPNLPLEKLLQYYLWSY